MPALFAYLIAIGLLLGGGYGALNWLAAPEPVKVLRKVKPKATQPSSSEARLNAFPEANQPANAREEGTQVATSVTDEKDVAGSSNEEPALTRSEFECGGCRQDRSA